MTFNLFYFILEKANIVLRDDALFVELLVMVEIKVNARVNPSMVTKALLSFECKRA